MLLHIVNASLYVSDDFRDVTSSKCDRRHVGRLAGGAGKSLARNLSPRFSVPNRVQGNAQDALVAYS